MNPSTGMSLTKTKFVHAMYTYLEFGFTLLKLSALFDHINLTFCIRANQMYIYVMFCDLLVDIYIYIDTHTHTHTRDIQFKDLIKEGLYEIYTHTHEIYGLKIS